MHRSNRALSFALALVFSLTCAGRTLAQPRPPRPLELDITQAAVLTPAQLTQINEYASYWGEQLAAESSSPETVEKARVELIRPTQRLQVTPIFRFEYSRAAMSALEKAVNSTKLHTAVNAVLVLANLGSDAAARELLLRADIRTEPRWQVRLHAARGAKVLLRGGTLPANKIIDAARKLKDAAINETEKLILRHQFEAINEADSPALTQPADREQARAQLVAAVNAVIERIATENNNPHVSPLVEPVNAAIVMLRTKFVNVQLAEQRVLGASLGPALGQLLEVLGMHWESGHENQANVDLYAVVVGAAEGFLAYLDAVVRTGGAVPQTKLRDAWVSGNKDAFRADVQKWRAVLGQPPYAKQR